MEGDQCSEDIGVRSAEILRNFYAARSRRAKAARDKILFPIQRRMAHDDVPEAPGVYAVLAPRRLVKIGSSKNIRKRIRQLQIGSAEPLKFLGILDNDPSSERSYHKRFEQYRVGGEWFQWNYDLKMLLRLRKRGL